MKKLTIIVVITGVVLTLSGVGCTSEEPQPTPQSQSKPRLKCQEHFDAMDTNHDGVVTKDEFLAGKHPGGHAEDVFKSRDGDGDGKLPMEEFCSGKGGGQGKGSVNM